MAVERTIEIARPREEVFAFVSDPRNDVRWCPKVHSVEPVGQDRWTVLHRPIPLRPARRLDLRRVSAEPPARIGWTEDDGQDRFEVTYTLEPTADGGTRFTQTSDFRLGAPRLLRPLISAGVGRDVARQLRELKRELER
jgi:uncharacterized protein YndB with AHSA1/START domain